MEINQLLNLAHHCLHLCTSNNKEETIFSCLTEADVFVTNESEFWEKKFQNYNIGCSVKKPEVVKSNERIVVDGNSLGAQWQFWEEKWKKQAHVICIYNIDKLDSVMVKSLVDSHDKMVLSINKIRMISDKNLEKELENLNQEIVESMIKRELKTVILSLLLSQPLCGTDLVKILYQKFKVFISPGMLYPTLHELEKEGMLTYEYKFKNKVYSIKEKGDAKFRLNEHVKINSLLSEFLVSN